MKIFRGFQWVWLLPPSRLCPWLSRPSRTERTAGASKDATDATRVACGEMYSTGSECYADDVWAVIKTNTRAVSFCLRMISTVQNEPMRPE